MSLIYDKWKNNELLFNDNTDKFITHEEAEKLISEMFERYKNLDISEEELSDDNINEYYHDTSIFTYERFFEDDTYETFEHSYTTENNERVVAFGYHGHD